MDGINIHGEIDKAVKSVAPVVGISFGDMDDKSTWALQFADTASKEQIEAAYAVLHDFDIGAAKARAARTAALGDSDAQMNRAADDIIHLLITKGIVRETDFPPALIQRVEARKALRTRV